jgi:hypothetical protein
MQQELILHIGLPKTGSTSIQTFLAQNRSTLMCHAIDYLAPAGYFERGRLGDIAKGNGRFFAQSLLPTNDPMCLPPNDRFVAALRDAIEKCRAERVLLSSELFVFASEAGWSELVDICGRQGRKLRLIAAVRSHADIISSTLIELARSFGLADLSRERIGTWAAPARLNVTPLPKQLPSFVSATAATCPPRCRMPSRACVQPTGRGP